MAAGRPADHPRQRRARAARHPPSELRRRPRAGLQHPLAGPAAEARERVGDRLLLLGARARALPGQRLLPAQQPERGLPSHPGGHSQAGRPRPARASCTSSPRKARGFVIVTGPTGSGKSTTLAAMIDEINRTRSQHIVTIEDPIEFLHQHKKCHVNQREVGTDTKGVRPRAPERRCARTPTSSSSGEMRDTGDHGARRSPPPRPATSCSPRCTRRTPPQTIDRIIDVFPPHQQAQIRVQLRPR